MFKKTPDASNLRLRAYRLTELLDETHIRIQRGQNLQDQIESLRNAIDALPGAATRAGATQPILAQLFATRRWQACREGSFDFSQDED